VLHVLLVEDNPADVLMVREAIRSDGYHVLEANNYDEAIQIAQIHSRQINVVLVHPSMSASRFGHSLEAVPTWNSGVA
jgi:CheY-like chemotaxis protein